MKYLITIRHEGKRHYFKDEVGAGPRFVTSKAKAATFPHEFAAQQRANAMRLHWHAVKPYTFVIVPMSGARKNPARSALNFAESQRHLKRAVAASRIHSKLMARALKKYGEKGAWISGVGQDHFPESVKGQLRKYAHMVSAENDAAFAAKPKRSRRSTINRMGREAASGPRGSGFYGYRKNSFSANITDRQNKAQRARRAEILRARRRLLKKYAGTPREASLRRQFKGADR